MKKKVKAKEYLLVLQRYRSVITLIACIITLVVTLYAIGNDLIRYTLTQRKIIHLFRYFTTLSNMMTALGASFIIPYAISGFRTRHFSYPKWVSMLHFAGASCTTYVSLFTVFFIGPYNREFAFGGSNFYLHVVCPLMVLISFLFVESHYSFSKKDLLICMMPFFIYSILYLVNVVFLHTWDDLYMLNTLVPAYFSLPAMYITYYGLSLLLKKLSLYISEIQRRAMFSPWGDHTEPWNIKADVYGMGIDKANIRYDDDELSIPIGIMEALGKKYSIDPQDLLKVYCKGLLEGLKDTSRNKEK